MKIVSVEDCRQLKQRFDKYCETAEQHEFEKLCLLEFGMNCFMKSIFRENQITDQKAVNKIFYVLLRYMGDKDYSLYNVNQD